MPTIVYRLEKGVQLTSAEIDNNFRELVDELELKLNASSFTAETIKDLLNDDDANSLNADTLDGFSPDVEPTGDTIVQRDGSGNVKGNTFVGDLEGNVTGDVTGDVTGNATGITGQLPVSQGGTNASTASGARTNLGLVIGTNVQAFHGFLTALAGISSNGIVSRTGSGTAVSRTITGGPGISVSNGDGVSGNPTINNTGVRSFNGLTGDLNVDVGDFDSGTRMLFQQSTAPTGWTKITSHDNKALRIVSGSVSSGGSVNFTEAFKNQTVSGTVQGHTLSTNEMPPHNHSGTTNTSGNHRHTIKLYDGGSGQGDISENEKVNLGNTTQTEFAGSHTHTFTTGSTGGGNAHTHGFVGNAINVDVQYVDVIIAEKD